MSNILFKKNLELLTHFEMYKSDPNKDWSSFLLHLFLFVHSSQIFLIFCSFSCGTDTVKFSVSISTPKQMAFVHGGTNFFHANVETQFLEEVK